VLRIDRGQADVDERRLRRSADGKQSREVLVSGDHDRAETQCFCEDLLVGGSRVHHVPCMNDLESLTAQA
jgi:hypothetical protein